MPKNIVCFDLDGTLLDEWKRIHPADLDILVNQRDPLFIPTTGRSLLSVRLMFARNRIFNHEAIPFPMVLQNGSVIYQANEQLAAYFPFPLDVQNELIRIARSSPEVTFLFLSLDEIHILWENKFDSSSIEKLDFVTIPFSGRSWNCRFSKLMCISDNKLLLEKLNLMIDPSLVEKAYSMPTILEITAKGINKGFGLTELLKTLNLTDYLVYAAGDGDNDLPIIDLAHFSFAPLTGPEHIRARVDYVIDTQEVGLLAPLIQCIQATS